MGLEFEDYVKFRKNLLIRFGKPIEVSRFYNEYKSNPADAYNSLKTHLAQKMSETMIDIRSSKNYNTIDRLRYLCNARIREELGLSGSSLNNQFIAAKTITLGLDALEHKNPATFNKLASQVNEYDHLLKKYKIRHWLVKKKNISWYKTLILLIPMLFASPVFLTGLLLNYILYQVPLKISMKIKDIQFRSSFKFAVGLVLIPVYYLVLLLLFYLVSGNFLLSVLIIIGLPALGLFAFSYYINFRKIIGRIRYLLLDNSLKNELSRLLSGIETKTTETLRNKITNNVFQK